MPKKKQTFLDNILEKFGEDVLDNHTKTVEAVSTGCVSLDTSIGVGGIPKGMFTQLYGPEGSGKTTVALNTAKQVANAGGKVLYIDVENLLNTEILTSVLGEDVKIENIHIMTPDFAEMAFEIAEMGIESEEFELIVIDSIGSMISKNEKEKEFDKDSMGQLPKLVGRFIKRNYYEVRTKNIAILLLNQVRDKVGEFSKIKTFKTPGGHVLSHQSAVIIRLSKGKHLQRGKEKVGILTKFVIEKNKLAPPFRSFTIPIIFGQGIDYYSDLIDFARLVGVLTMKGSYYYFEETNIGQGVGGARETLMQDKSTLDRIVEMLYNVVNKESSISELLADLDEEHDLEE
jgi:recombination protein RecA